MILATAGRQNPTMRRFIWGERSRLATPPKFIVDRPERSGTSLLARMPAALEGHGGLDATAPRFEFIRARFQRRDLRIERREAGRRRCFNIQETCLERVA